MVTVRGTASIKERSGKQKLQAGGQGLGQLECIPRKQVDHAVKLLETGLEKTCGANLGAAFEVRLRSLDFLGVVGARGLCQEGGLE